MLLHLLKPRLVSLLFFWMVPLLSGLGGVASADQLKTEDIGSLTAAQASPRKSHFTDPTTGMEFVLVKGGCFQMGSKVGSKDAIPAHKVCVDDFYMGKYEVTQGQYQKITGDNPSNFKGENRPVENVNWNDSQNYIGKLNRASKKTYRLPTEAEWEYAARSGGKNETYAGSDKVADVAWYLSNSSVQTHPVGQKQANGLGLFDMSGNVWEWCQDWYSDRYYSQSPRHNPQGPASGSFRVLRGGSWWDYAKFSRTANRLKYMPGYRGSYLGFRLVLP